MFIWIPRVNSNSNKRNGSIRTIKYESIDSKQLFIPVFPSYLVPRVLEPHLQKSSLIVTDGLSWIEFNSLMFGTQNACLNVDP